MADDTPKNGKQAPGNDAAKAEAERMEAEQRERIAREQEQSEQKARDEAAKREEDRKKADQGKAPDLAPQGADPAPASPGPGPSPAGSSFTGGAPVGAVPLEPSLEDEDYAAEMERRREFDAKRARKNASSGLSLIIAHALAGGMSQDEVDEHLDAAMASRTPTTALTGALGMGSPALNRTVGPNDAVHPVTPLAGGVNAPSPRAASALPAGSGQVVKSSDPRFKDQEMVNMTFISPLTVTLEDHSQIHFRAGTQPVPESLVDHWYIKAASATRLDAA